MTWFARHINWGLFSGHFPVSGKSFLVYGENEETLISYRDIVAIYYKEKYSKIFNLDNVWASAVIIERRNKNKTLFTINPKEMSKIAKTTIRSYYRYLRDSKKVFPYNYEAILLRDRAVEINKWICQVYEDICDKKYTHYNYNNYAEGIICFPNIYENYNGIHSTLINEAKKSKNRIWCFYEGE